MVPGMATYQTILTVPQSVEETFSFVSDFRNAALWDPRTYAVEKSTEGPIGVGTRFMLTGGMLRQDLLGRLHIPESVAGMPLPYDVVEFDAPNEFVLEGESRVFRYRDHLEFSADDGGTLLHYAAELELKGAFAVGERLLQAMFQRIGDDATRDLPATVMRGTR
jgi:hypothetical protein